jgi:hypothetical protein
MTTGLNWRPTKTRNLESDWRLLVDYEKYVPQLEQIIALRWELIRSMVRHGCLNEQSKNWLRIKEIMEHTDAELLEDLHARSATPVKDEAERQS